MASLFGVQSEQGPTRWFDEAPKPPAESTPEPSPAPAPPRDVSLGISTPYTPPVPESRAPRDDTAPTPSPSPATPRYTDMDMRGMARSALSAILSPERLRQHEAEIRAQMDAEQAETGRMLGVLDQRQQQRDRMEAAVVRDMREFREGIEQGRVGRQQSLAELRAKLVNPPEVPDLQVRPWLHPEGKNALSVIAQTLGMLATGIGGMVIGAPKTALTQLKEAADLWRRDEVDAANSKFNEFKASIDKAREQNVTALATYDREAQAYGANELGLKAALATSLDALGLHDAATASAMLPHKVIMEQYERNIAAYDKIGQEYARFGTVAERLNRAADWAGSFNSLPKARAAEVVARAQAAATKDPAERDALLAKAEMAKQAGDRIQQDKESTMRAYGEAQTLNRVAGSQIPKLQGQLDGLSVFVRDAMTLDDAITKLDKAGILAEMPTKISEWQAWMTQQFSGKLKDKTLQDALQTVVTRVPILMGTYERRVELVVGPRFREAFAIPHNPAILTESQLRNLTTMFMRGASNAKTRFEERLHMYTKILPSLGGGEGAPPPSDQDDTDTDEKE